MFDEWNLDDTDFMNDLNDMFSIRKWLKNIWKWIKNVGVYWIPVYGICNVLVLFPVFLKNNYIYTYWLFYQSLIIVFIIFLISLMI